MVLITGDPGISTMYIGSESLYPDVHRDYYAFNAISLCVEKDIMDVNPSTGNFDINGTLTGVDAISMMLILGEILK
jgi:hypothetical protein